MALSLNMLDDSEVSAEVAEGLVGGDDSMESEVVEVLEASEEVTESEEMLEEAEEAQDNLESFREIVRADIEAGERLSPAAARHMLAHANTIFGRVGVEVSSVNTESFSSPSDSADALLQVNMEAEGLWGKIVDFVMKIVNKVRAAMKGLWVKMTDAAPSIAKRAKALAEKAAKTTGTMEHKDFDFGSARSIHLGGKVEKTAFVGGFKTLDEITNKLLVRGKDNWKKRYKALDDLLDTADAFKNQAVVTAFQTLNAAVVGEATSYGFTDPATGLAEKLGLEEKVAATTGANATPGNGVTTKVSDELLGGKWLYVSYTDETTSATLSGNSTATAIAVSVSFKEGMVSDSKLEVDASQNVATLSTNEVQKVCNAIEDIANRISKYRRAFDERDGAKTKVMDKLKRAQKNLSKAKDDELNPVFRRAAEKALRTASMLGRDELATHLSKHAIVVCKASLGYCEKSLAQYK